MSQVLPWLRYVSVRDPQRVKNTSAVTDLTCLATKGLKAPRDETDEISRLTLERILGKALKFWEIRHRSTGEKELFAEESYLRPISCVPFS